ncbi:MAG: nucleotidyltransferase family protein, partial [Clostridia bacterium]|nr:nucleotidyltransferase family protein [Clostridia bacterium]
VIDDGTESNETRLGAVKDIQFAIEQMGISDDLLIIAGDNLLDFSLCAFLAYAKKKNTSAILRYYEPDEKKLVKCGVVTVDENDKILRMTEKSPTPETHWCTPPFYFYKKDDIARVGEAIADGCGVDAPGSLVAWLAQKTTVSAMEMPGSRYDIGNLESYENVQKIYKGVEK